MTAGKRNIASKQTETQRQKQTQNTQHKNKHTNKSHKTHKWTTYTKKEKQCTAKNNKTMLTRQETSQRKAHHQKDKTQTK